MKLAVPHGVLMVSEFIKSDTMVQAPNLCYSCAR
jgi:hypothetical protein